MEQEHYKLLNSEFKFYWDVFMIHVFTGNNLLNILDIIKFWFSMIDIIDKFKCHQFLVAIDRKIDEMIMYQWMYGFLKVSWILFMICNKMHKFK